MQEFIAKFSGLLRDYLPQISTAIVATLLALYGGYINDGVKKSTKALNFLVRFCIFVFLCAFGYGMLGLFAARLVRELLLQLHPMYLAPVILGAFVILGVLADQKRKI